MKKIFLILAILILSLCSQTFAGTDIVKADGSIYTSPVDNDPSDANFVRAIDAKFGISFESKRQYVTDKGKFNLNYATFSENGNDYIFKLNLGRLSGRDSSMQVYLKMFDKNNIMVDVMSYMVEPYDREMMQMSTIAELNYKIKNNNYKNISKIEFTINPAGIDPMVFAHNFVDPQIIGDSGKYPDVLSFYLDPSINFTDEQRANKIADYNKRLAETSQSFQDSMNNSNIHVVEIQ